MKNLDEINQLLEKLERELVQLNTRRPELLKTITGLQQEKALLLHRKGASPRTGGLPSVTEQSFEDAKIALFRSPFRGREDVYARRFENMKTGKKGYWPVRLTDWVSEDHEFLPVTDEVVKNHLLGVDPQDKFGRDFTIGVYPMLADETCYFLAGDFDKATWKADAGAFLETCKLFNIPAALQRSRSGNGGHVWIFFSESIPATLARKMGTLLSYLTPTNPRIRRCYRSPCHLFIPHLRSISQSKLPNHHF